MTNISELETYVNKQTINSFDATIEYVKKEETRETQYGILQTQSILVTQGEAQVWVSLNNKPVLTYGDKGKGISFKSVAHSKGFGGVTVNRWEGKKGQQWNIKVTKVGEMAINGQAANALHKQEEPDAEDVSGEIKQRGRELPAAPDILPVKANPTNKKDLYFELLGEVTQDLLKSGIWDEFNPTFDDARQIATSLFIEANKR